MRRQDIYGEVRLVTNLKPELSNKSKYHISKHRYYELKHFCLQYPEWKQQYLYFNGENSQGANFRKTKSNEISDQTHYTVSQRLYFKSLIELVEECCSKADADIGSYILKAVTQGLSFVELKMKYEIPCGKDMYYDRYRRFFWILDSRKKPLN